MKLALASDHGGVELKDHLKVYLEAQGYEVVDYGTHGSESVDYPDYATLVAEAVVDGACERGILVCGTGIGMSIAANKVHGIRAALCGDAFSAQMCREHNDANILCLGQRVLGVGLAETIVDAYLGARFAAGRHERRVAKIMALEK